MNDVVATCRKCGAAGIENCGISGCPLPRFPPPSDMAERDQALLDTVREGREAEIADAATRAAYRLVADWLSTKQAKAEQFPGGDLIHAAGRANAYQNAAQGVYGLALKRSDDQE